MRRYFGLFVIIFFSIFFLTNQKESQAAGPLRVLPSNPRYFTDRSGRVVYLTGIHNTNFQTYTPGDGASAFDYNNYLNILQQNNYNFIRLWVWEHAGWVPLPYSRPGPGTANDGQPKFDLNSFNRSFFDDLRSKVIAARDREMYVSVMLFDGWSINNSFYSPPNDVWGMHPFNASNNINGINGDLNGNGEGEETHTLANSRVTAIQDAYVRKVVDTVNDLDNVLFEISNETRSSSRDWQYHMANLIHSYEAGKSKQHPVGMTATYDGAGSPINNELLFASPAEWISPASGEGEDYALNPPASTGSKVIISDTDHQDPMGADNTWVWRSFTRGLNTAVIDGRIYGREFPTGTNIRAALSQTRTYAEKADLASMAPRGDLSSTGYALANPGSEYILYAPSGGSFSADVQGGSYSYEWFSPISGSVAESGSITAPGGSQVFTPPFSGEAVLYLRSAVGGGATACHLFDSSQAVSAGFGASHNVLSSTKELLVNAFCAEGFVSHSVGNGSSLQYIYNQGYYWTGSNWQNFIFSCSNLVATAWCVGNANHTSNMTASEMANTHYYVAYVCNWTGSEWKCGCRDSACATNYWLLQAYGKQ
jgi:hypothetical protein